MVHHFLHVTAPRYLSELCTLDADVASRETLADWWCHTTNWP